MSENPWLKRLQAAGVSVKDADFEAAREQLEAQWSNGNTPSVIPAANQCPTCAGTNVIKVNPDAQPWDDDFGKVQPCPDSFHDKQRQAALAKISNLSVEELAIKLSDCKEIHDSKNLITIEGIVSESGKHVYLPQSNCKMLAKFRELTIAPYGQEHFIYVWGPFGGGKTYAGMALVNEINQAHKGPAMFITLIDLLQFLKAAYDDRNRNDKEFGNWSFDRRYDTIKNTPVIVLDEFDLTDSKTQATEHNLYLLQRWVNDRYRKAVSGKSLTVFLSNSPVENTELGSIISRINDSRFKTILNSAPDWRRKSAAYKAMRAQEAK